MLSIGLDVHERTSSVCILDSAGRVVKELTVKGHPRKVLELLLTLEEPFQICFEASTNYGWLYDQLKPLAVRVLVAHPGRLRLIFRSRRKNDRLDAARLAKLLFLDEVPVVHVPGLDVRAWRGLIEHRQGCVGERTRIKNGIRSLLRSHGIESVRGRRLWTRAGRAWLAALELPTAVAMLRRDQFIDDLEHHERKIKRVEKALAEIAAGHPGIALLRTIPGIGLRTAEAFLAYVDDPQRFAGRSIGAYLGMVPRQDASAGVNRLGRITREGPATVRQMLAEATWQAIRRSGSVRQRFERIRQGQSDRTKKALVATAHYLARVMIGMLNTGEAWKEAATA
jgi:transposase